MRPNLPLALLFFLLILAPTFAARAHAQLTGWDSKQFRLEQLDADRLRLIGQVEIEGSGVNAGQKIFADDVEWNQRTGEATAVGNVMVSGPESRISAERAVINTVTGLGTFYTASGIAALGERGQDDRTMFGSLEPEVYFYGEWIEKVAEDKYKIHKGGFTTCVQPTPRWEIVSNDATINLGDYAILRNAVMHVKDVPVFYLPILYYPIQDDGRATGFLMPTYGNSTYAGQSVSNAFFWAIDRSQDATIFHDWFLSRGQSVGGEYRYSAAPGSEGSFRTNWLNQSAGVVNGFNDPARRSYQLDGSLVHRLPGRISARARVDYFSDVSTQQIYQQNIYEASRSQRTIDGSVTGSWAGVSVTGNYRRLEQFITPDYSIVNGTAPSLTANLSSRQLGDLPVYVSMNTESGRILYSTNDLREDIPVVTDRGLGRIDISPQVRSPLLRLPFLTLTGTAGYRVTYYSQSMVDFEQVPEAFTRRYGEFRAELLGPVLSRVFTPANGFADRVKHLVEPTFAIQRRTSIDEFSRVPTDIGLYYDTIFGGVTQVNYGVTNRFLLRKLADPNAKASAAAAAPREFLSAGISQSYYSDERASQYDQQYQSGLFFRRDSNFSPVAINVRSAPTTLSSATARVEYDTTQSRISSLSVQGGLNHPVTQVSAGWSRSEYLSPGTQTASFVNHTLNAGTTLRFSGGRSGGTYNLNWDVERGIVVQQRWSGFFNAQCCGLVVEYQEYNFGLNTSLAVPKDRRFNIGFTLAGVGTFQNPFGTFGGGARQY